MADVTYWGDGNPQECEYAVMVKNAGVISELNPRLDLRNHSPTGLSWGYLGSGPAQTALAILCHATNDDQLSLKYYQRFKQDVIARLPNSWQLSHDRVLRWLAKEQSPYGQMCADPELCKGLGSCPRDPTCGD